MATIAPISQQIWDMKYRLKGPDQAPLDRTLEDSWRRVACALAEPEADRDLWSERFYAAMEDFRFLPAGRILAGAGAGRTVTLFNCFVMGTVPDDMSGIFEHLREAALTMQQGGGIGYDFSTLRPKGAPVKGVGADASGPLSFMDVWDAMCRTIMSAGHRRGAMMATMRCDHPDIEAFIDAKREPGRLRMFNLSVLVTDPFMVAVKEDASWELKFNGTTYRVVQARDLWDRIMRATYAYAEPGVIFIDRINRRNNLHYCETINATNPCITADSWVQTSEGPRQVAELLGRPLTLLVNGQAFAATTAGFFSTGVKRVLKIVTKDGFTLRATADHPIRTAASKARARVEAAWTKAGELQRGDMLVLHDHGSAAEWPGAYGEAEGRRAALLITHLAAIRPEQAAQREERVVNAGSEPVSLAAAGPQAGFAADIDMRPGTAESQMRSPADRRVAAKLGLAPGRAAVTPAIESCSSAFYRGFLRRLFDADSVLEASHEDGVSIRLPHGDLAHLQAVQRMLLRLGIVARLIADRRGGAGRLSDGRAYLRAADHLLVLAGANVSRFAERIGYADRDKRKRLTAALRVGLGQEPVRERFLAEVAAVLPDGEEEVFDVQVPGINAFDANGLYVHNCGEQPLPPYGACLLGSINLARLVDAPFTPEAALDEAALDGLVRISVRMMDNTIDVSRFPLPQQEHEARAKRRIGLGVTGLADALILCRARYGSAEAVRLTERWMAVIRRSAYLASTELAAEKGAFPLFDRDAYLASETVAELDEDVRQAIATHGIRNSLLTSIAPTGTISLLADNVSSGLEPVFSLKYTRNVLQPDGTRRQEEVSDYAYRLFRHLYGEHRPLPDYFVDAQALTPSEHVIMQAAVQRYIDSSISKTINVPADLSFTAFKDIYAQAYELGCKGCTTYRPNDITGAVLEVKKEAPETAEPELDLVPPQPKPKDIYEAGGVIYMTQPLSRPEALPGQTYKVRWPDSDHAIYITINDVVQDGRRRPFEVFINSKNMDHYAWTVALTRMISAVFRRGGDISFVVEELKAVFDPRGGQWMNGRYVPSLLAAIGEVIERHMLDIGMLPQEGTHLIDPRPAKQVVNLPDQRLRHCPKCAQPSLVRQEGCDSCTSCGYSKCG